MPDEYDGNEAQGRKIARQLFSAWSEEQDAAAVRTKLTLTEVGVIVSLLSSICVGIFTLGVVYGQVQRNTADIAVIKPKVESISERIDANVEWLRMQREGKAQ
jgi:hypothetical protein